MSAPLQIEWEEQSLTIPDNAKGLIINRPQEFAVKILGKGVKIPERGPMRIDEFWIWFQTGMSAFLNEQLETVQARAQQLEEEKRVQFTYLQKATQYMVQTTFEIKHSLEKALKVCIIPATEPEKTDWQWDPPAKPIPFLEEILEQEVKDGTRTEKHEESDDAFDRQQRRRRHGALLLPLPERRPEYRPESSRARGTSFGAGPLPLKGKGKATAGGNDPSDPSSSEKEDPAPPPPKKNKTASQATQELLEMLVKAVSKSKEPKPDAPKPKAFKGDPEDLERFIQGLENVWAIKKKKYRDDLVKIRYTQAANLLERLSSTKHRDPVQWYEAYYSKIDLAAARRLPGGHQTTLDPAWAQWEIFVKAFRSSFGTKVGKEQAVTDWLNLRHSNSIDEYLDTLTNLMWRTGYPEEVAKDKLVRGLNKEVGLAWAQIPNKPQLLGEQMAMIRDIGHNLENFHHLQGESRKEGSSGKRKKARGRKDSEAFKGPSGKKRKRDQGGDYKDREAELAGIPNDVIEERKKSDSCLKCGKGNHKWFECWTKDPVTSKVANQKSQAKGGKADKKNDKGEVKISVVNGMEDKHGGRIIELAEDSDGDYFLLK